MKARVLERLGGPLSGLELPLADPVGDQVLVRLTASGVCHSDLHALDGDWTVPLPLILGHEGAGVVEAIGPDVRDVVVGDHVVLSWFAPCRRCKPCSQGRAWLCTGTRALEHPSTVPGVHAYLGLGTFAEATVVPESAVVAIDPAVPAEVAALIGCSVATGVGAVLNTAGVRPGESAVVVGCGGVGQAIVLGLVLAGADPIVAVEESAERREQALSLGATSAVAEAEGSFDHAFEADAALADLRDAVGLRTVLVTEPGYRLAKGRPRVSGIPGVAQ